jgi:hypothetical protein
LLTDVLWSVPKKCIDLPYAAASKQGGRSIQNCFIVIFSSNEVLGIIWSHATKKKQGEWGGMQDSRHEKVMYTGTWALSESSPSAHRHPPINLRAPNNPPHAPATHPAESNMLQRTCTFPLTFYALTAFLYHRHLSQMLL